MFGEVYLCRFPYTDGVGSKVRPALVLFDFGEDAVVCRVTGRLRVGSMNVPINDWSQAGLLKPSIARLDKIITAERSVFSESWEFCRTVILKRCVRGGMSI